MILELGTFLSFQFFVGGKYFVYYTMTFIPFVAQIANKWSTQSLGPVYYISGSVL
jgi:hypothetical protein